MRVRGGLTRRLVIATAVLAVTVQAVFVVLLFALAEEERARDRVNESQRVLVAANELERLVLDLETGERGYLITRQERFLDPWEEALAAIPGATRNLETLTIVPGQHALSEDISVAVTSYLADYSVPLVEAIRRGDPTADTATATEEGKQRIDGLRAQFDDLLANEDRLAAARTDRAVRATRLAVGAAVAGIVGSIVLIVGFGVYLTRSIIRPLRRGSGMARRLAEGDLAARLPDDGVGEIGELQRSFNGMAGSLEESRRELDGIVEEQAALRRVATLVASGVPPAQVFDAVAMEVGRLLGADSTRLWRYEPDNAATAVAAYAGEHTGVPLGTRFSLDGVSVAASVLAAGAPARLDVEQGSEAVAAALRDRGLKSAVGAPVIAEGRIWGAMSAVWSEESSPRADAEARIAEFTELVATAIANASSRTELAASRTRIVAASDEARRRIERDLHDGVQQRLVSLGLDLRNAEAAVPPGNADLGAQLDRAAKGLAAAVEDLQEVSRGIHPAILSKGGLLPAVRTLARRSAVPVELRLGPDRRLPEAVEVAAYYVVSEALTNAAKHARATVVEVGVDLDADGMVRLTISDDGIGGADPGKGSGLVGLRDRVEAVDGTLDVTSTPGAGTTLVVTMPTGEG